ncbi:hypothetical protein BBO99_00007171 [Phytophthora kernoviae]|uniref:Uncharacterized protein n=1 Tax=Phytophthora kernoviae TaxID=325452 RepID=A0A421F573_9STRA|nr:hypothetical protein BBI17_007129 [Phytophthora kernoviae]RLN76924.1 hypothetical protein BBO99_00007171 [Phytophthora kernoviae]
MTSSVSPPTWDVTTAIEEEEAQLAQKAAIVKRFATRCQRDIETNTAAIGAHHKQMQASYLKELQRKYDSKKHMTLMTLRDKYEKETKALVRAKVEEYEVEEAVAVKRARSTLLEERTRALQDLQSIHEVAMEEHLTQLEIQLTTETEREKIELNSQLQEELRLKLKKGQQLERDLEKKNRVAVMELHDSMQTTHQGNLQVLKDAAEQRRADALDEYRKEFELECRQELQSLEKALEQETGAKLRQLEIDHADECELKLEQLRTRVVNQHSRELEAKTSRMIQCKNVLLAEASAFLSFENVNGNYSSGDKSESNPEDNSAATHLLQLKKHLSKELAQYVDVMAAEFDEIAEEQRILVAKITESTQLYLSYKRQCGVLEGQSDELESGLETLHDQLQQKDAICKKLYQANEALLKRLHTPALQAPMVTCESDPPSLQLCHSPALAKALKYASPWHNDGS